MGTDLPLPAPSLRARAGAIIVAGFAVTLLPVAAAADSMRCGSRIIKEEDTINEVLEVCGEPVSRQRTWIQRQPSFEFGGVDVPFPGREDVPVDTWIYDFGSHRLRMKVRFVDGEVESIVPLE